MNEGKKLNSTQFNLEDLKNAQKRKDAEVLERKNEEKIKELEGQAEARHQEEVMSETSGLAETRELALKDLRILQGEADKLKKSGIEILVKNFKALQENKIAKEEELQKIQEYLDSSANRLLEMRSLAEGRAENDIAEELRDAIKQAKEENEEVGIEIKRLKDEIYRMELGLNADQQVKKYQEIIERISELDGRISDIESNPLMVERLFMEASTENEMRENIIEAALGGINRTPKEKEFISQFVQRFLTEEFNINKFDEIKDAKERESRIREFTKNVTRIVSGQANVLGGGHENNNLGKVNKDELVGVLLKNLVGKYGTMAGSKGFLELASGGRKQSDKYDDGKITKNYIYQHLGSINYLRAAIFALKDSSGGDILETFKNSSVRDINNFDQHLSCSNCDITSFENQATVPMDADKDTKNKIEADFQKNLKEIILWKKGELEKFVDDLNNKISQIKQNNQEIAKILPKIEQAQERDKIFSADEAREKAEASIKEIEEIIKEGEARLEKMREDLNSLGMFSFGRAKKLKEEINWMEGQLLRSRNDIANKKRETEDLVKAFDSAISYIDSDNKNFFNLYYKLKSQMDTNELYLDYRKKQKEDVEKVLKDKKFQIDERV